MALVTAALAPPTRAEPKKVVAFSDEYLALLAKGDEVARILSLGERIVFVLDSAVYEVVPAPEPEAGK